MTDAMLRMLAGVTLGLLLVLVMRRAARHVFGAGAAFALWLLPLLLAVAPWVPHRLARALVVTLPGLAVTPGAVASEASRGVALDWAHAALLVWLVGSTFGLARLVARYIELLRGVRGVPVGLAGWLAQVAPTLDARRVRVHAAGPAVLWAWPRALILLPADFAEHHADPATRALVLHHEHTHVRRGDPLWSLVMELASALLWFHPLAWLARPRFRLDQELACDAAALRAQPDRVAGYARALLDSVAARPAPALIPWLAEPQLKERIAMLTIVPPAALRRRAGFIAIAVLLAGGTYAAIGMAPGNAATPAAATRTPPRVDIASKNSHPPAYPAVAVKAGQQGTVILDVAVDAAGQVADVRVDPQGTTADAALQAAAIAAARSWKYHPGSANHRAVGGVVRIPVAFSLAPLGPCPSGQVHAGAPDFRCVPAAP